LGGLITPIIKKQVLSLDGLKGKSFAVDAYNILHQFLALIRTREGRPLTDKDGNVTSHLVGLVYRTTRLISEYNMKLVFVFDGKPPLLKYDEVEKRRNIRKEAEQEFLSAIERGDLKTAYSKAVMTGKLTKQGIQDAKKLLDLLGIPWIQAPSEGEAQAAHLTIRGDVWAVNSRDYDSLLFGSPRLVRYLTISGEEWLPSKRKARKLFPELIELSENLRYLEISREQLIDLAILIGTDFNKGLKGIGPKTALKLIKTHKTLEALPKDIQNRIPENFQSVRNIYLAPPVTDEYNVLPGKLDEDGLYSFLCEEREFSKKRVELLVNRIKQSQSQRSMTDFFGR
jgi:flap endonuclease-1